MLHLLPFRYLDIIKWREGRIIKKLKRNGVSPEYLKTSTSTIKYWKGGEGPNLFLIHGFGGNALLTWHEELLFLKKNYTIVAPDLLWFGESESSNDYNLMSQCNAVIDLMNHLNVEKATFVGQSYGGFVSIGLAKFSAHRIEKLILANCPGTTLSPKKLNNVCQRFKVNSIEDLFICENEDDLKRLFKLVTLNYPEFPNYLWNQLYKNYFANFHQAQRCLMQSLQNEQKNYESIDFLAELPIVMIWSQFDELFPEDEAKNFAYLVKANFLIIKNAGHAPQFDNRKAFQRKLIEALN